MSFLEYLSSIYNTFQSGNNETETRPPCVPIIDHQKFHLFLLIPSSCMILLLAFTITRKKRALDKLHGRPGAVFPMNILGKSHRSYYAAAWGSIAFLTAEMITQRKFAFTLHGPPIVTACNGILSMFIYGVDYFPLFASLALESVTGYVVGTLYAWMLLAVNIAEDTECNVSYKFRLLVLLRDIPNALCLGYLSISLPVCIYRSLRRHTTSVLSSTEKVSVFSRRRAIGKTPEGKHVLKLMVASAPSTPAPDSYAEKIKQALMNFFVEYIYDRNSDFRYSARMVSILTIGVMLIYKFTLEGTVLGAVGLSRLIEAVANSETTTADAKSLKEFWLYVFTAIRACFLTSIIVTCCIAVISILNTLTSYKQNLLNLYKGKNEHIPLRSSQTSPDLLAAELTVTHSSNTIENHGFLETRDGGNLKIGAVKYAGYQVGYIGWGLIIHSAVLFILALFIALLVSTIKFGYHQWVVDLIRAFWPIALTTLIFWVVQYVAARLFLQEGEFALDNRRALFTFTFFMFFYNVFLGLFSCLLRILKSMLIGLVYLPRLDHSALPSQFRMRDPGFAAYVGFIHLEVSHTHPVLVCFLRLLVMDQDEKGVANRSSTLTATVDIKDVSEKKYAPKESNLRDTRARTRWQLFYTLFCNPELRYERKHHIAYVKALRERVEKKQQSLKAKQSEIGSLVAGINNTFIPLALREDSSSDTAKEVARVETSQPGMNWHAVMGVNRFIAATRAKSKRQSGGFSESARGVELAMLEMENAMISDDEDVIV